MPKNINPVATLTVDKADITLPANVINLTLSGTDANLHGTIDAYQLSLVLSPGGVVNISTPNSPTSKVTVAKSGTYQFGGVVTDNRGGKSVMAIVTVIVHPVVVIGAPTKFGAILVGSSNHITAAGLLGIKCARTNVTLIDWKGKDSTVDSYYEAGYEVVPVISWSPSSDGADPYYTNLTNYRTVFEKVMAVYKNVFKTIVIENEATTDKFHSGPIENYIALLKIGVEIGHKYGIKVTDSGMALSYVSSVMSGHSGTGNINDTSKIIDAIKSTGADYANVHNAFSGNTYPKETLKKIGDWLLQTTGKPMMSNEWHLDGANFTTNLMTDVIAAWKYSGVPISIIYSGDGTSGTSSRNAPLITNGKLTPIGVAYRDGIK